MKSYKPFSLATLLAVIAMTPIFASASTIYEVNRTAGTANLVGFIETDGTIGVLTEANIVGFGFTLTDTGTTEVTTLTPSSADLKPQIIGTGVTATATEILFDYSSESAFAFTSTPAAAFADPLWCNSGSSIVGDCYNSTSEEMIRGPNGTKQYNSGLSGIQSLASVSTVPLPAAAWLFGSALLGLGVVKRRKA